MRVDVTPLIENNRHPEATVSISRQDIVKYSGASGDFNLVHVDETFARNVGHDSVIAMGMLTAGIAGTLVNQWVGVENVREFSVRFESIVYPGDTLTYIAEVTETTDNIVKAELTTTNQDDEVVLSGETTADLPR